MKKGKAHFVGALFKDATRLDRRLESSSDPRQKGASRKEKLFCKAEKKMMKSG